MTKQSPVSEHRTASKQVYRFNPLEDVRWDRFVLRHARSSLFHSSAWLKALHRTYGYVPIAFTTSSPATELSNAAVFCLVKSWLTGRRLVSLPFSDHCDLLVDRQSDCAAMDSLLAEELRREELRYIERRLIGSNSTEPGRSTYCLHQLDLRPGIVELFRKLHQQSTQRKIRRAEREGLTYQEGRSEALLQTFDRLWLLTRRRHLAPPQPLKWFRNLIECFGEALSIQVAFKDRRAVAAILTLRHKDVLVYKYGCSDARFHPYGAMHALFWRAIVAAKQSGARLFDLGRSEWRNQGLITFKDRLGASRVDLTYSLLSSTCEQARPVLVGSRPDWRERLLKRIAPSLPDPVFRAIGTALYRHIG